MKDYTPQKLAAISRYQNCLPTLPVEIREEIYQRMKTLIQEEKEFCDKGNFKHMAQILTSIAMYEVLQQHGKTEAEAYRIVSKEMWKFLDPSGMQKIAKKRFFLPLMKKIVPLASSRAPASAGATPGTRMIRKTNFISSATSASMRRSSAGAA